jgi:hypothetical protein
MKRYALFILATLLFTAVMRASETHACLGSIPVSTFKLLVVPAKGGPGIPLTSLNMIQAGETLKYEPVHIPAAIKDKARIGVVMVPVPEKSIKKDKDDAETAKGKDRAKNHANENNLIVLEAKPAKSAASWKVPVRASIVGVVFGPRGLDIKKVNTLVDQNQDIIPELADYAQQSTKVEALVQVLSQYEQSPSSGKDLNAALTGFSQEYNVAVPKLDTAMPTDQQASQLLQAVMPSLSTYDPLTATRTAAVAQSMSLAGSVAGVFFGTPVGLAAGGAALFQNLRTMLSPDTEFRAAFSQSINGNGLALCAKAQPEKARTRTAYLWMVRIPDVSAPSLELAGRESFPVSGKCDVKVRSANPAQLKLLSRARDWRLVSGGHESTVPVAVVLAAKADTLQIDLSRAKLSPGEYELAAKWDWDPLEVKGKLHLRPYADFAKVHLDDASADLLVQGSGTVPIHLSGADFEFVSKAELVEAGKTDPDPQSLKVARPAESILGEEPELTAQVDTSKAKPGNYDIRLTQTDGKTQEVPVTVLPPNPVIKNLPLRVNLGEKKQTVRLQGGHLERIMSLKGSGAIWELAQVPSGSQDLSVRDATVWLEPSVKEGDQLSAQVSVEGLHQPLELSDALTVAGPRPRVVSIRESAPVATSVALEAGEIPAGTPVSFALDTQSAGTRPILTVSCGNRADLKQALDLRPGQHNGSTQLDFAGDGVLFLSLDPGVVGQPGCQLTGTVSVEDTGVSDPAVLGRVIRLPRLDIFTLSNEKVDNSLFAGKVVGQDLQLIAKVGWDGREGYDVLGIPAPDPTNPANQTLRIGLPWPPPAPMAPLYIWLRGEAEGRVTRVHL